MIYVKPSFYKDFKCVASKCSDNCCVGWEIDVDEATLNKYKNIKGDFGRILLENIEESKGEPAYFKLKKNDRCPFLNKDNLCDIIINCGEDYLCDICNNHPRFFFWLPGVTECGLGLSCEEVSRLLLETEFFSLTFEGERQQILTDRDKEDLYIYKKIFDFREEIFNILKNNKPYYIKKAELIKYIEKSTGEDVILKNDNDLIDAYFKTEPINEEFTFYINEIKRNLENILKIDVIYEYDSYSKALAYMIYRHLVGGIYDYSFIERLKFSLESVRFIEIMDKLTVYKKGNITFKDRIENLKNWSKQIEYSEENTELLIYGDE